VPKPSLARDLFDQIQTHSGHADSVAYLRDLINPAEPPTFETEFSISGPASVPATPRFRLKDGTVINLFVRDLPRFSVDIDLTYLSFDAREEALRNILAGRFITLSAQPR
jgi:hypothetical protein